MEKPALINLDLVNTKDGSAAEVTYFKTTVGLTIPRPKTAVGRGLAKRHPNDIHNAEIGELLAVGRALEMLGRQLVEQAERKVNRRPSSIFTKSLIQGLSEDLAAGRFAPYEMISDV